MPLAEDDWRLRGQEDWLADRPLRLARWTPYRDGWDHDHCEFCWAEISTLVGHRADAEEAYVTADDNYSWICSSCFVDFHDRFRWTVIEIANSDQRIAWPVRLSMRYCDVSTPDPTQAGPGLRILQYVYFGLWSNDTSADVITEILHTAPDATWARGSRSVDPPRPVSHKWAIECRDHDLDVGEQIRQVLARVRPIAPRIRHLTGQGDVVSRLSVVRYLDDEDGQPESIDTVEMEDGTQMVKLGGQHQLLGWYLDAADLELLVALNSSLDVDEYN